MLNQIYILCGIVLYEMLTARVPFDADTPVSVALKQVQEEPIEPIEYNDQIPVSVNMIILKAMQKNPNCRYQNATEMLEDLSRSLKEPNENFIVMHKASENSPTQKIPTIYDLDKNTERKSQKAEKVSAKEEKKKSKIGQFFAKHKVLKVLVILLICIGLFLGAMFATLSIFSRPDQIQIPNLVVNEAGNPISEEEAIALLDSLGLTNHQIEYQNSDDVEKGYVISQKPEYQENYTINENEEIKLIVSQGSLDEELAEKLKNTKVKLPKKMVGKKQEDLIKELEALTEKMDDENLKVQYEIIEEFNEEVEAGIVTEVDHDGGEEISLDTVIKITVSKGSQYKDVTVKSVINRPEAEAKSTLEALGLVVDVTYEENANKSDGIVTSQSVAANKTVKEGTSITLTVNKLPTKSKLTVNVNLKSLMKYTEPESSQESTNTDSNETTTKTPEVKSAKVVIKVGEDNIYSETKKLTTTDISASYTTSGVKEVKVYVDDVVKYNKSVDFSAGDQTLTVE